MSLRAESTKALAWNEAEDGTSALCVKVVAGRTTLRLEVWAKKPEEVSRLVFTKSAPNTDTEAGTLVTCCALLAAYAHWLDRHGWPGVG